jgi:hypothetical protein
MSLEEPLALKTRREAMGESSEEMEGLSSRLIRSILREQRPDGSWEHLIVATAEAVHGLLDCDPCRHADEIELACDWLFSKLAPLEPRLFPLARRVKLDHMFYTDDIQDEINHERAHHPEYRWGRASKECLQILPIYQTCSALGALCRCGHYDDPRVGESIGEIMKIRGPGGVNYTQHWCACNVSRWQRRRVTPFGEKEAKPI